jgi:polar amino acid transport system substrate-binding protein
MKKLLTLVVTAIMLLTASLGLTACGNSSSLAMGKEMLKYKSQLDAIVQLDNGTVDAVVIDSIMGGYYCVTGDYAGKIAIVPNLSLAQEEYGIAGRKEDKAFVSEINKALIELTKNGTMESVANTFGVKESLSISAEATNPLANANDNSWEAIKTSGKIVVGITIFAPIAYYNGATTIENLTGFDIELAKEVVKYLNTTYSLNLEIEFSIIDWNSKEALLENGSIDLVWNGMTITEQRSKDMCISVPYLYNKQVAIVKSADLSKYSDKASFKNAVIGVEAGSAGESVVVGK